jgi:hypothetical protein
MDPGSAPSTFRQLLASATVLMLVSHCAPAANAQSAMFAFGMSAPVYRGTRGAPHIPQETGFGTLKGVLPQPHLDPVGRHCVEVFPLSTAQTINQNIYDQNLLMNNQCSQKITLSVCYYQTRNCSNLAIAGYTRQLKLFGVSPEKEFRIEYREYVN